MPIMSSPPAGSALPNTEADAKASDLSSGDDPSSLASPTEPPRVPSLRSISDPPPGIALPPSASLASLNAARRPGPGMGPASSSSIGAGNLPQDMQARMKAFHLSRQGTPPQQNLRLPGNLAPRGVPSVAICPEPTLSSPNSAYGSPSSMAHPGGALMGGVGALRLPQNSRPQAANWASAPTIAPKQGLSGRRGMKLPGGLPGAPPSTPVSLNRENTPGLSNPSIPGGEQGVPAEHTGSLFNKFSNIVDTKTGSLKFAGKAVIHGKGVDFSGGSSFSISLDEVDNLEELGKGNYGTVYKVRHSRPRVRVPGQGLGGSRPSLQQATSTGRASPVNPTFSAEKKVIQDDSQTPNSSTGTKGETSGIIMAMKEIRLELDEAKFAAIIMELDILHRCTSPFIVDFYGAFFQEGAVYICLEYMDGGSVDRLYGDGVPEPVLKKIALSTVMGLKSLKDDHEIIHRDVKPTNILVNTRGQVKICDFGVSGNLVASIAKTNIGCQSYMAPERIASGGVAQAGAPGIGTYSVQSDIWSLGLSIIECALGRYPYPPETYNNIFSQLSAIVEGDPPDLPAEGYSAAGRDFVRGCLNKTPKLRPTYAMLLRHEWLAPLLLPPTSSSSAATPVTTLEAGPDDRPDTADPEVAEWVASAIERRKAGTMGKAAKPALHAAPLDAVPSPSKETGSQLGLLRE